MSAEIPLLNPFHRTEPSAHPASSVGVTSSWLLGASDAAAALTALARESCQLRYLAEARRPDCLIPLMASGDGTGVLAITLRSEVATQASISGLGRFYSDAAGTLDESQSAPLAAGAWSTLYVRLPSDYATITIAAGYAVTGYGHATSPFFVEGENAPHLEGFDVRAIALPATSINIVSSLGLSLVWGSLKAWSATPLVFTGARVSVS